MDTATRFRLIRDGDRVPWQSRQARTETKKGSLFRMLEDATAVDFEYLLFAAAEDRSCDGLQIDCPTRCDDLRVSLHTLFGFLNPWVHDFCCVGLPVVAGWPHVLRVAFPFFHYSEIPLEIRSAEYLSLSEVCEHLENEGFVLKQKGD